MNTAQVMRSLVLLLFLVAVCVAALPRQVVAQGGPPLLTDDPETPGNGHWEINIAWTLSQKQNKRLFAIPLIDINYGLGQQIQLKAEIPWLVLQERRGGTQSGIGSANFGVKWRFLDKNRHGFAMSTYPQLEIRTSASSVRRGLIEQGGELLLPVEISRELGPVTINGEVGYQVVQREKDEVLYGLVVGGEINKRFELVGEIHGTAKRNFGNELIFNVGGRFRMSKHYTLLFSTGRSLRRAVTGQPTLLAYVGSQFNF